MRFETARLNSVALSLLLAVAGTTDRPAIGAMEPDWVEKWKEDLAVAQDALLEKHPDAFDTLSPEELQAEFEQLAAGLPELDHRDVIVGLTRIVARVGDGHTRVTLPLASGVDFMQGHSETESPALDEMVFHQYPLRFGVDGEGVWIRSVSKDHPSLLGGRLVAIDGRSTEEVVELVGPTIRRDNEMQLLHHLPMHLVLPELLSAQGVTSSAERATFKVERRDGSVEDVVLSRVPDDVTVEWVEARPPDGILTAFDDEHGEENFAFTYLEAQGVIYLQFNTVYDSEDETIRQFSERLAAFLDEVPDSALVIDLRRNRGGNQSLALPLLHAVIGSPQNRAGQLFTIIGRTTFSAAMTFSLLMEKHTQTLFVGEPTGSKPNHYGDSRKTLLPNSNVTLRISSLYWQWSPRDDRKWIEPHMAAPPSREAVLAGSDPALESIESLLVSPVSVPAIAGEWRGNLPPGSYGMDSILRAGGTPGVPEAAADIPAFGLSEAALENLEVDAVKISFEISIGSETISYRGTFNASWIVGEAELGSVRYPFLLKRIE